MSESTLSWSAVARVVAVAATVFAVCLIAPHDGCYSFGRYTCAVRAVMMMATVRSEIRKEGATNI